MTPRCPHCHAPDDRCRGELPECRARCDDWIATAAAANGLPIPPEVAARRAEAFRGEREHPRSVRGGR